MVSAVKCNPEVQEPSELRFGRWAWADWGWVQSQGQAHGLVSGSRLGCSLQTGILCPFNHTLFTLAHVSKQLFPLPLTFKTMLWNQCIWAPKDVIWVIISKDATSYATCALIITILKHLLMSSVLPQLSLKCYQLWENTTVRGTTLTISGEDSGVEQCTPRLLFLRLGFKNH